MSSILDYFGDSYSSQGTEQKLKMRVKACFQRFQTDLLIIDEAQHLNYRNSERSDVTDSLKRLLDDGVVPIVFLGTEEARDLFTRNVQLGGRLLPPCDLKPLDFRTPSDRGLLAGYTTLLDQAIVTKRILPEVGGLQVQDMTERNQAPPNFDPVALAGRLVEVAPTCIWRRLPNGFPGHNGRPSADLGHSGAAGVRRIFLTEWRASSWRPFLAYRRLRDFDRARSRTTT